MPTLVNARLSEMLDAAHQMQNTNFQKKVVSAIFIADTVSKSIIDCTQNMRYRITFPTIGYKFLYDQYSRLYRWKRKMIGFMLLGISESFDFYSNLSYEKQNKTEIKNSAHPLGHWECHDIRRLSES